MPRAATLPGREVGSEPFEAKDLVVRYPESGTTAAVDRVSLRIEPGEFLAVLGPSGSGKSTLLRTMAGFITPAAGRILRGETDVTHLSPQRRNFGVVFQSYALFPHMTVEENVAFGLRARRLPTQRVVHETERVLDMVGMTPHRQSRATRLSGGQQQRVALARALVIKPDLLLMDEPLAALDLRMRQQIQLEIKDLQQDLGISTLYVTHDQEEAFTIADRVIIMDAGRISAEGPAEELYARPGSSFAAAFLGYNTLIELDTGVLGEGPICNLPGQRTPFSAEFPVDPRAERVLLVIPPHRVRGHQQSEGNCAAARVVLRRFVGTRYLLSVEAGQWRFALDEPPWRPRIGDELFISWDPDGSQLIEETADGTVVRCQAATTAPARG